MYTFRLPNEIVISIQIVRSPEQVKIFRAICGDFKGNQDRSD